MGDFVEEDDVIAEIETDKVSHYNTHTHTHTHTHTLHCWYIQTALQVPAPVSGVLEELLVADGDTVTAGTELARIRVSGQHHTHSHRHSLTHIPLCVASTLMELLSDIEYSTL